MRTREERKRCKKGHETTIGKIIYGFLLFLPLIAIGVTCGYAMFNKNAYQSYNGYYKFDSVQPLNSVYVFNEATQVENTTDIYTLNNNLNGVYTLFSNNTSNRRDMYFAFDIDINEVNKINNTQINQNAKSLCIRFTTNNTFLYSSEKLLNQYTNNFASNVTYEGNNNLTKYTFTIRSNYIYVSSNDITNININLNMFNTPSYFIDSTVSNVFYYAIDKVTQSSLFNWSQNSMIYTGISNFTTALSITNTFVPTLLTYWLIISIVYFMYDIVLMMLTILHRKIHDLQDSI